MSTLEATWTTPQLGWRDPQIASGHEVVVVSSNTIVGFYDKTGALLPALAPDPNKRPPPPWTNPISVAALFAPLVTSLAANHNLPAGVDPATFGFNQFYDNRVIFDPYRNRFWIGALAINANTKNEKLGLTPAQRGARRTKFLLAVSVTEDPRYGWHLYWWDATKDDGAYNYGEDGKGFIFVPGDSGDYPYIGIDNGFSSRRTSSATATPRVVPRPVGAMRSQTSSMPTPSPPAGFPRSSRSGRRCSAMSMPPSTTRTAWSSVAPSSQRST
jgi:hypothetical protein